MTSLSAAKTPPRNNYAQAPHSTPIASAKRPRQGRGSMTRVVNATALSSSSSSLRTPSPRDEDEPLSPMHTVRPVPPHAHGAAPLLQLDLMESDTEKDNDDHHHPTTTTTTTPHGDDSETTGSTSSWVGRKVDALFSPVLQFLNQHDSQNATGSRGDQDDDEDDDEELEYEEEEEDNRKLSDNDTQPTSSTVSSREEPTAGQTRSGMTSSFEDEDDEECNTAPPSPHNVASTDNMLLSPTPHPPSYHNTNECSDDEMSLQAVEQPADTEDFNPWQFIKTLPPYDRVKHLAPPCTLPPKDPSKGMTLVLDLDETLVHCTVEPVSDCDMTFPVDFHGTTYTVHVRLRPYLFKFLEKCNAANFEVIVFTASQKVYANELLNLIDKEGKYVQHRLYRESCLQVEGNFLKDLNVLGRDLRRTCLVDNSPHAFGYQVNNGIPIESWFDDPDDRELLKLDRFLKCIKNEDDVRTAIRDKFQSERAIAQAPAFL